MQCKTCGYKPTQAEIEAPEKGCPNCAALAAGRAAGLVPPATLKVNPSIKKAMMGFEGAQAVVVVDLQMSFNSMVWFMVKWVLASIPAFLILVVLLSILGAIFGGVIGSLFK